MGFDGVRFDAKRLDFGDNARRCLFVPGIIDGHIGPGCGKRQRDAAPDAARRSGNEGGFALETVYSSCSSPFSKF